MHHSATWIIHSVYVGDKKDQIIYVYYAKYVLTLKVLEK